MLTWCIHYSELSPALRVLRISVLFIRARPTLNLDLGNRWFFTFYPNPDIRVNFGDPVARQTGRLFLPFDGMVGRVLKSGWVASLEVGVPIIKDYPFYDFKTEGRVHFTY